MLTLSIFDVVAGILVAEFYLGAVLWGFRTEQSAGWNIGIGLLILGAALVVWRLACWTGKFMCG